METKDDWRQRYLELADLQEGVAETHAEVEREYNRLITRLCVAVSGFDPVLDPHLERLRQTARGAEPGKLLDRAGEIVDALLHAADERTYPELLKLLLERSQLGPRQIDEVLKLWGEVAADPAHASDAQLDRLSGLLAGPEISERRAAKPGLLARLLGKGGGEGDEKQPNLLMLGVLRAVTWPSSLHDDVESFRNELATDSRGDAWVDIARRISDLAVGAMGQAQDHARSAETFLTELNERLEELDQHMLGEVARREDSKASGERLGQEMDNEVVTLSASLRESADLVELQSGVIGSLNRMHNHVRSHLEEENLRREKAEAEAEHLRRQLRRVEEDTFDLRRQVAQTYQEAMRDALTGLPNRRAYDERVVQEYARWKRFGHPLALLVWDVDDFKRVNDTFGHKSGDKALIMIAKILRERLRETDFLARYGGEEFVMLLAGAAREDALRLAEKMRHAIENGGLHANGQPVAITLSGGLSLFAEGDRIEDIFERADNAMYRAKRQGKNCVVIGVGPTPRGALSADPCRSESHTSK